MKNVLGFSAPIIISFLIFALNALLPGRWLYGYISRPGSSERMRYHLNGILVFYVIATLWFLLGYLEILPFDYLYKYRWHGLAGACTFGLIFTLAVVLPHSSVRKSFLADVFFGRTENLQLWRGRVDIKMWLYLTGATMLGLNILSFSAYHLITFGGQASAGVMLSTIMIFFFILDYLIFEEVHLYTYDLFAEKIGFKLGWGCIVFYPYFYAITLWSSVDLPDSQTPSWLLMLYAVIFLTGWILARGANMQKYFFKKFPGKAFLGIVPETITDGNKTLLVNGFWGMSRHINYLGEILMATGIVLCVGRPSLIWPWLYPLYYVVLLFARQHDDNKRCSLKYGELWNTYVKKVPYRIIPFIY
jgi:protein-S-isoprenylcysteine O-methyltransferase Ste14